MELTLADLGRLKWPSSCEDCGGRVIPCYAIAGYICEVCNFGRAAVRPFDDDEPGKPDRTDDLDIWHW